MITGASGYRNVGSGVVTQAGNGGGIWSASPGIAAFGRRMQFDGASVVSQSSSDRGFGFPLRCIQAFTCTVRTSGLNKSEMQESITAGTSGYRNVGSGMMAYEGSNGYYWSSSPSSAIYGIYLFVYSGGVSPQHNDGNRGNGFPLRCIQELALFDPNHCSEQGWKCMWEFQRQAKSPSEVQEYKSVYDNRSSGLPQRRLRHDSWRGQLR